MTTALAPLEPALAGEAAPQPLSSDARARVCVLIAGGGGKPSEAAINALFGVFGGVGFQCRLLRAPTQAARGRVAQLRRENANAWGDLVFVWTGSVAGDAMLIRELRAVDRESVVLAVSACASDADYATLLSAGADDYWPLWPREPGELQARAEVALRLLNHKMRPRVKRLANIVFDIGRRRVYVEDDTRSWSEPGLRLTPSEFELLGLLISNGASGVSRSDFKTAMAQTGTLREGKSESRDVVLSHLRRKLKSAKAAVALESVDGVAYLRRLDLKRLRAGAAPAIARPIAPDISLGVPAALAHAAPDETPPPAVAYVPDGALADGALDGEIFAPGEVPTQADVARALDRLDRGPESVARLAVRLGADPAEPDVPLHFRVPRRALQAILLMKRRGRIRDVHEFLRPVVCSLIENEEAGR
ncbi:MAG: response regulator transcription factor [Alphaproteobacteria bacterium]|nr:response regulator transcription factor [Alphaproteobacteria bacterium]